MLRLLVCLFAFVTFATSAPLSCAKYCGAVLSACVDMQQYKNNETCMAYCTDVIPASDDTVVAGNTLGCRYARAVLAAQGNANTICPQAGPTGDGYCGTVVQAYCNVSAARCKDVAKTNDWLETYGSCVKYSAGVPVGGSFSSNPPPGSADTLLCRFYHATNAVGSDGATTHCPHHSLNGGGICGSNCAVYCRMQAACGTRSPFANEAGCNTWCKANMASKVGTIGDLSGDSLACRIHHASVVIDNSAAADLHCPHVFGTGTDVCGTGYTYPALPPPGAPSSATTPAATPPPPPTTSPAASTVWSMTAASIAVVAVLMF